MLLILVSLIHSHGSNAGPKQILLSSPLIQIANEHNFLVRIQVKKPKKPKLEWQSKEGKALIKEMNIHRGMAETIIPRTAQKYRILYPSHSTSWFSLSQNEIKNEVFRFVVYGGNSSGETEEEYQPEEDRHSNRWYHQKLVKRIILEQPELILHTGSMVVRGTRRPYWQRFFEDIKEFISAIPFHAVQGEGDRSKTDCCEKFFSSKARESYHAFKMGGLFYISLDTTKNFAPGSRQYDFLKNALQASPSDIFQIIILHHPPFSNSFPGGDKKVLEFLVPLFEKYHVDLVLSGQNRNYQRLKAINGVNYIVSAGGGGRLTPVKIHPGIQAARSDYHYIIFEWDSNRNRLKGIMKNIHGIEIDHFELSHNTYESPLQPYPRFKTSKRYR